LNEAKIRTQQKIGITKTKGEIVLFTVYAYSGKPKGSHPYIGESIAQNKKQ